MSENLPRNLQRAIKIIVDNIPGDWETLAYNLGSLKPAIDQVKEDNKDIGLQCRHYLQNVWYQEKSHNATVNALCQVLESMKRIDVKNKIENAVKDYKSTKRKREAEEFTPSKKHIASSQSNDILDETSCMNNTSKGNYKSTGLVSFKNNLCLKAEEHYESQFGIDVVGQYKTKTAMFNGAWKEFRAVLKKLEQGCIEAHLKFFQSSDLQYFLNCYKDFNKLTRFLTSKHKSGDDGSITVPILDEAHYEQVIREMKDREDHLEHTVSDSEVDNINDDTHILLYHRSKSVTDLYTSDDTNPSKKGKFSRRTPQFKHKAKILSKVDYLNKCLKEKNRTIQLLQDKTDEQVTKVNHLNSLLEERDRTRGTIQVENNLLRQGITDRAKKSVEELFAIITQLNARNEAMEMQLGEYQRVKKGYLDDRPTILRIDDLNKILTATGFSEAESSQLIDGLGKKGIQEHSIRDTCGVLHNKIKVLEDEKHKLDEQSLKYVRKYNDDTEALKKDITSMSAKVKVAGQTITQLEGKLEECKKAVEELFALTSQLNAKNEAMEMKLGEYQGVKKGYVDDKPQVLRLDDLHRILTATGFSEAESSRLLEGLGEEGNIVPGKEAESSQLMAVPVEKGDKMYKTMMRTRRLQVRTDTDGERPWIRSLIVDEITSNVVVCDWNNRCIKCFDSHGSLQWKYTTPSHPWSVAMLRRTIAVTLQNNNTMLILRLDGSKLSEVKHDVHRYGYSAIAVYEDHVLICDYVKIHVYRMSQQYQLNKIRVISTPQLSPCYIHVTLDKTILVSERSTHTLHAYNWQGEHQFTYSTGKRGQGVGELYMQHAVCTDSSNNILVADRFNHRIVLLSPRGQFIRHLLTEEDGILFPEGLAVTKQGLLYVSGCYNTVDVYGE